MIVKCDRCKRDYDDADCNTMCPHGLIMPAADLAQKKAALALMGHEICFAHMPDGPSHRIQAIGWNGMVTLYDMTGEFAPHLFAIARGHSS